MARVHPDGRYSRNILVAQIDGPKNFTPVLLALALFDDAFFDHTARRSGMGRREEWRIASKGINAI